MPLGFTLLLLLSLLNAGVGCHGGSTFERFCLRDAEVLVYWLCMGTCCCCCCCGCVGPDVAVAPVVASLVRAAAGERDPNRNLGATKW